MSRRRGMVIGESDFSCGFSGIDFLLLATDGEDRGERLFPQESNPAFARTRLPIGVSSD